MHDDDVEANVDDEREGGEKGGRGEGGRGEGGRGKGSADSLPTISLLNEDTDGT